MPARPIVVLQKTVETPATYRYLLRADVPVARRLFYANQAYVSPFVPIAPDADPDLAALRSGAVVEEARSVVVTAPLPDIQAMLVGEWVKYQDAVNAVSTWSAYGSWCSPAGVWTMVGV